MGEERDDELHVLDLDEAFHPPSVVPPPVAQPPKPPAVQPPKPPAVKQPAKPSPTPPAVTTPPKPPAVQPPKPPAVALALDPPAVTQPAKPPVAPVAPPEPPTPSDELGGLDLDRPVDVPDDGPIELPEPRVPEVPHFEIDTGAREPVAVTDALPGGGQLFEQDPNAEDLELDLAPRTDAKAMAPARLGEEIELGPAVTSAPLATPVAPERIRESAPRRHVLLGELVHFDSSPKPGFWRRFPLAFIVPLSSIGALAWLVWFGVVSMAAAFAPWYGMIALGLVAYGGFLVYFGQAVQTGVHDVGGGLPTPRWKPPSLDDMAKVLPGGVLLLFVLVGGGYLLLKEVQPLPETLSYWLAGGALLNLYLLIAWTRISLGGGPLSGLDIWGTLQSMYAGGFPFLVIGVVYIGTTTLVSLGIATIAFGATFAGAEPQTLIWLLPLSWAGGAWAAASSAFLIGRVLDERDALGTGRRD